jgi:GNAT superfamily N-acetyltransferase
VAPWPAGQPADPVTISLALKCDRHLSTVTPWSMAEITVRVLDGSDWPLYRDVRLRALEESPASFSARLADEADQDEQFWRDRMDRAHRLLAERDGRPQGIASLGPYAAEPSAGEIFGLYVVPEARSTGVSWRLVEAAAALASREGHQQLYYWVGIDNGRAIGFAKNFGFRSTGSRRPSRVSDLALGDYETALVLPLVPDDRSAPNPTSDKPAPRDGPIG